MYLHIVCKYSYMYLLLNNYYYYSTRIIKLKAMTQLICCLITLLRVFILIVFSLLQEIKIVSSKS